MAASQRILVKLSGEALIAPDGYWLNPQTLSGLAADLADAVSRGFEIAVVMDPFADVVGRVINVANANRLGLGASRNLFCFGVAVNANAKPILKLWG